MNLEDVLDQIEHDAQLARRITRWQRLAPRRARYADFPAGIDPRLVTALRQCGIEHLYTHQAKAVGAALRGENVVVVTPTASGKTLCYNLPVLNTLLADPSARALYLFPTKALAQDQLAELGGLRCAGALREPRSGPARSNRRRLEAHTYDGDTPQAARPRIRKTAADRDQQSRHAARRHPAPPHPLGAAFSRGCATSSWTRSTPTGASLAATWPTSCAG